MLGVDFFNYYYGLILLCFCFAISFSAMARIKYKTFEVVAIWIMASVVTVSIVVTYTLSNDITDYVNIAKLTYILGGSVFSLTSLLITKDSFPESLFKIFTNITVFIVLNTISVTLARVFVSEALEIGRYWCSVSIRTALYAIYTLLYLKVIKTVIPQIEYKKKGRWWPYVIVSIMFLAVFSYLSLVMDNTWNYSTESLIIFGISTGIFIIVYWALLGSINNFIKSESIALMQQNEKYLKQQLSLYSSAEEEMRKTRHDIRHHNMIIAEFARNGENDKILEYIKEYDDNARKTAFTRYSVNDVINAILVSYSVSFDKNNIKFTCECEAPKETKVLDTDFVAILANILENALHGCLESNIENPFCNVQIRCKNDKLAIRCQNSCSQAVVVENGMIKAKGTGISSIQGAIEKYDGEMQYKKDDDVISLQVIMDY